MDYLDSRDLQKELVLLLDSEEEDRDEEDRARIAMLEELRDETEGMGWRDGICFIPESEFEDYARELAEDIGAITGSESWPNYCIDWERAARELAMDYTMCSFDGTDYYYQEA